MIKLKVVFRLAILVAILLALGLIFKEPLYRYYDITHTVVRLGREDLQPPLLVPVKGVRRSELEDSWGAPRGGGRRHEGIDIFARCGRPVLSATEGIVVAVGENHLGGHVVWVLGPALSSHYYAHLGRFALIHRGDHVHAGDVLGYVDRSGNAATTPCHLHYGIYRNGHAIDPYPYLHNVNQPPRHREHRGKAKLSHRGTENA